MESVVATRILSSRPRTRTMTARPSSSARPITTTGLMAPRTARGRSALHRQVQDKTYWMGILRAKMNELTMEIAKLSKECETMSKEESRINMWQRRAESLARELKDMATELSVYNEYLDRVRIHDDRKELVQDIESIKVSSHELSNSLESKFKEKKQLEEYLLNCEKDIQKHDNEWLAIKRKFDDEQRERFERLENTNRQLSSEAEKLESQISKLREKKASLEGQSDKWSSSSKKEAMKVMNRLRELEKQKNDLIMDTGGGDERTMLLAQMKRDNAEMASIESRLQQITKSKEDIESTLSAYEDLETTEHFKDLKRKESTINAFLEEFPSSLASEMSKMKAIGDSIRDTIETCNKFIRYVDTLKDSLEASSESGSKMSLVDEKRKLELDLKKIQQLEVKIAIELESLRNKISTLTKGIENYSDVSHLKSELESKGRSLEEERKNLNEKIHRLNKERQELVDMIEKTKISLEENDIYKRIKEIEVKLSELASINEDQEAKLRANDNKSLKKQVMDMVNRYNQSLLGF